MLCFDNKSCFLREKPKVGNRNQTELNSVGKVLSFEPRVSKVKTDQTTGELTIISSFRNDMRDVSASAHDEGVCLG